MNMAFKREMPSVEEIRAMYPLTDDMVRHKQENDRIIRDIITGADDRFLLIIGPCSADREDAVLEYTRRLREVQEKVRERIVIIPRVYTDKPRTTGAGYKGMMHQPDPADSPDLPKGLTAIRKMHTEDLGDVCSDFPENPEDIHSVREASIDCGGGFYKLGFINIQSLHNAPTV